MNPSIPLNFNKIAGVAKTSPELLYKDFYIDKEGSVHLKTEDKQDLQKTS